MRGHDVYLVIGEIDARYMNVVVVFAETLIVDAWSHTLPVGNGRRRREKEKDEESYAALQVQEHNAEMARRAKIPVLTSGQARYILEKLIDEGKVSAVDIRRHLAGMWQEMTFIEKRIAELRGVASSVNPLRRVRRSASKALSKSLALQGQYIGFLRQIPEGDRKPFQNLAREKGRAAAIAALKKRLRK
jgi:hypothetical protein